MSEETTYLVTYTPYKYDKNREGWVYLSRGEILTAKDILLRDAQEIRRYSQFSIDYSYCDCNIETQATNFEERRDWSIRAESTERKNLKTLAKALSLPILVNSNMIKKTPVKKRPIRMNRSRKSFHEKRV